jgi:hypothetical protein
LPRCFEAVHPWHSDIHQDDLGSVPASQRDRLLTVRSLTDDGEVGLRLEDQAETGSDERLVVDDQDACGHGGSRGRRASTA